MNYQDPNFDAINCDDLNEMQYQTRALATDLGLRGLGLGTSPIAIAREVYAMLLAYQALEQQRAASHAADRE